MSQLRLLKPFSVFKNVLSHTNVRMFSYSPPTYPFMLIDYLLNLEFHDQDDGRVRKCYEENIPNCFTQKRILISDLELRYEVGDAMTSGFLTNESFAGVCTHIGDEKALRLNFKYKPSSTEIENERIYLPPLPSDTKIQNFAMSCLPNPDNDWVVGIKLSGSRLSLCRPFSSSRWINLKAMPESISPFSSIMFSKKDQKFYIPSPGGKHLCSVDLHFKEEDQPKFIRMKFDQLPKSVLGELEDVSSCTRTDHLVESPTGELFLVKWYVDDLEEDYEKWELRSLKHKTKQFMVFRAEVDKYGFDKKMIYTEDIGDLCIFLGYGEALCLPASLSPGLRPNCIYFVGYSFGVYDLTTKTCTNFVGENDKKNKEFLRSLGFPYWPVPLPLD